MKTPGQTFVVGTGRCGSTLISNMLRLHPEVTSLSEVFSFTTDLGARVAEALPDRDVTGAEFWAIVATAWPRQNLMLRHSVAMPEVLYAVGREGMRFDAERGVPAICQTALPHLTDDPDAPFAALEREVPSWPSAPAGVQYQRLFAWLTERDGGACWVERSGGGLRLVKRLARHFPDARFVHILRDGRDTAISMSRHRGFRMVFACFQMLEGLGVDPFESGDRRWEEDLPDDLAALLPERFTAEAFEEFETPAPLCAHYWAGEIAQGLEELAELAPDRLLTLRYEHLLEAPESTARALIAFIRGEVDETWVTRAAALVRPPRSRRDELSPRERVHLEQACRPGLEALRAHGLLGPQDF
jgi:hypothetical protein